VENQHRKIAGYRELDEREIQMMNMVKEAGEHLNQTFIAIDEYLKQQREAAGGNITEYQRIAAAEPLRWSSIARTHFQQGLMALTRAVAQPGKF
jgi:hypothetical protein